LPARRPGGSGKQIEAGNSKQVENLVANGDSDAGCRVFSGEKDTEREVLQGKFSATLPG
jgi:hypothetical protein